jgi:hypothetical protein
MGTRYIPNPDFRRELEATAEFKKGQAVITSGVAAEIKAAAEPFRHTGYFISKIRARRNRVELRDSFTHLSEFGSVNNPPQANVRRGVTAAGLRFEDDGPKQAD